jgi:hypothetical protein
MKPTQVRKGVKARIPKGVRVWEAVMGKGTQSIVLDRARTVRLHAVRGAWAPGPHICYWQGGNGMMRWVIFEDVEVLNEKT